MYRDSREKRVRTAHQAKRALSVLIGPNGSGKSNTLDALGFVRDAVLLGLPAAVTHRGGISSVRRHSHGHPYDVSVELEVELASGPARYGFILTGDSKEEYRIKAEHATVVRAGRAGKKFRGYSVSRSVTTRSDDTGRAPGTQSGAERSSAQPAHTRAPGRAPRTQRLVASASPAGPVQRRVATSAPSASAASGDDWTMVAFRPDMHQAPVQRRAGGANAAGSTGPRATGSGAALPGPVQARMENSFGADFSDVRVHQGGEAESMGALAYTQGTDIHFAPGQYDPTSQQGQELIGHELTHVVQQSQGRVTANKQAKGAGLNDDPALEREADEMGARAARGEAAEVGGMGATPASGASGIVQRQAVDTSFGTFTDEEYSDIEQDGRAVGVSIHLSFTPNDQVDATKIAMVQSVKSYEEGEPTVLNPSERDRIVGQGDSDGYMIDRVHGRDNPVYGSRYQGEGELQDTPESNAPEGEEPKVGYDDDDNATYVLGHRKREGDAWVSRNAEMADRPQLPSRGNNAGQEFETTALAVEGEQKDRYYGSVRWGWVSDDEGAFERIELTHVSDGDPSANFMDAAELWNRYRFVPQIEEPDEEGNSSTNASLAVERDGNSFTLAAGTALNVRSDATPIGDTLLVTLGEEIRIQDGSIPWMCWVPQANVAEGRITVDTESEKDGNAFTIAAESEVETTDSVVGETVLVLLKNSIVTTSSLDLRMVWAKVVDIRGGDTIDLPTSE